jgi:hypothetical protein
MEERENQTIELDCPPGHPRPGDLIGSIIEGTSLPLREAAGAFFGNWTWDYRDIDSEVWKKAKPILRERISKLHDNNIIRYGSW